MNNPKEAKKAIAARIRSAVKDKNPSQAQVARDANMNPSDLSSLLSKLETGSGNPGLDTIFALEKAIGKPLLKIAVH